MQIRDCAAQDYAGWRRLWDMYLAFYETRLDESVIAHTWARILDASSPIKARLAVTGESVIGFAIYQHHPSTWAKADDGYLEDLCVDEAARGQGVGRALIDDVLALGRARGWARFYWHTNASNLRAQSLYNSYAPADGYLRYRLKL